MPYMCTLIHSVVLPQVSVRLITVIDDYAEIDRKDLPAISDLYT